MNYQTFQPHPDLAPLIKCYWILEVPSNPDTPKQRVIPDGCIELFFILGDEVKRYTTENEFIIQPRAMVLGQITKPLFIQPKGEVNTFAVRFYPYGFANFADRPISELADKETPISELFGAEVAAGLEQKIIAAESTEERIRIVEEFLIGKLTESTTIDRIVKSTIDALLVSKGSMAIHEILKDDLPTRRSLERKFTKQVGISPKQLSKVFRLQAALKLLLSGQAESLTTIAYESEYYDQAHFIKDFKEFTGINPKGYLDDDQMQLSSLLYSKD